MSKVWKWVAHSSGYPTFLNPFLTSESDNSFPGRSIQPGKLSWRVRPRYTPPSDATDSNGNLAPPWWLAPPNTPETPDAVVSAPSAPVLELEKSIVEVEAGGSGEAPASADARWCIIQALDGNPRRSWWQCLGCGRINQRDMLIHRRCPSCQVCSMLFPFRPV